MASATRALSGATADAVGLALRRPARILGVTGRRTGR
jgi:hypothetical protein